MEKTPQTLRVAANIQYLLAPPDNYAPKSYKFTGWRDVSSGELYQSGDIFISDSDATLLATWQDIREYPESLSLSVYAYNDGFVRHKKSAELSKEIYNSAECLRVVPLPASEAMDDTVNLDGYHYRGAGINLPTYKYAALILHCDNKESNVNPMLTFAANSGKILKSSVEVFGEKNEISKDWTAYVFDLSEISDALGDAWDYNINQIYIHPYGKRNISEISENDTVYIAKLMFFAYNPCIGIETQKLSDIFKNESDLSRALAENGITKDFEDTEISYITANGSFVSLLADTATLCNKALKADTEAGEKYLCELDERCRERIAQIRSTETSVNITGTTYYVSNDGNDDNDGLSENTPWKTIDKVNTAELKHGDGVLFKRGDLWRGVFLKAKAGVTYSAYGKNDDGAVGEKPKLYGSPENGADASKWSLYHEDAQSGKKIWVYDKELSDIGLMVFNDGEAYTTKAIPSFIDGKFVLRDNPDEDFDIIEHLCEDLMLFSEVIPAGVWVSGRKGKLYLRCDKGNPGELYHSIEFNTRPQIIELGSNPDVTFDNLCIKHSGSIAIHAWDASEKVTRLVKNFTVTNCEIGWIGGGIQCYSASGVNKGKVIRLGNGVEIYGGCDGYVIDNCYIYQCYDAGFTVQCGSSSPQSFGCMKNAEFRNNIVDYCIYGTELWNGNTVGREGRVGKSIRVIGNIIRYCGEGFGKQRYNLGNATAIMGFHHENVFMDYEVCGNVFAKSTDKLLNTSSEYVETLPRMQGNTYVQSLGGKLGFFGVGKGDLYDYDMTAKATIENIFGDKDATVYYVK